MKLYEVGHATARAHRASPEASRPQHLPRRCEGAEHVESCRSARGFSTRCIEGNLRDGIDVGGGPLLDRGPRGVEPTLFGRAVLKRSLAIFDELRQTVTDIDSLLDPTAGMARIGTAGTLATGLVPAVIERLTRLHPRISFYVVEGAPATLQRELRERNVELLLARALPPIVDEDLELEVLFNERQVVVAGSASKWARRRQIEMAELLNEP